MDFVSNKQKQISEMLATLGIPNVEALFRDIPVELRLPAPKTDDGMSEYEVICHMEKLAAENTFLAFDNYLGAGCYEHHLPALVSAMGGKSEFLTSYTPYQAEASQGMLQAIFEFQSAICALTGMDVANASVYDGACACAEAVLMALRHHPERSKVVISGALHPHYRAVVNQYLASHRNIEVITLPENASEQSDFAQHFSLIDEKTAAVLVQRPDFFGILNNVQPLFAKATSVGALSIICANPLTYGLYASAAELGADIAVGDCQPLGISMQFGGPGVGYMAVKQSLLRQLPGRIVGKTKDSEGRTGFVLTLQAREQHIRREKATSNICTNQALAALASLVAILWYGPQGIAKLALTNFQRASYLRVGLSGIPGVKIDTQAPILNEFVVTFDRPAKEIQKVFRKHRIEPGLDLGTYFPKMNHSLLVAVTEIKSQQQLDRYLSVAESAVSGGGR